MVPCARSERFLGFHAVGVVHPDVGDVDVNVAFVEMQAVAFAGRVVDHAAGDAAVGQGIGIDPGGDSEGVRDVEGRDVAGVDDFGTVEIERRGAGGVDERGGRPPARCVHGALPGSLRFLDLTLAAVEGAAGGGDFALHGVELRLLFGRGRGHQRGRVAVLHAAAEFGQAVEEGVHRIEVLLQQGVVLVVVAARAAEGKAEEDGGRGFDAVDDLFGEVFLGHNAVFGVNAVVAVEAGGYDLGGRGVGQEVAGELLDDELVVGLVGVEGVNHPVAPAPHVARAVVLIAVGVGVAGGVEPAGGHAFAVAGGLEQAVDGVFEGLRGGVGEEGVEFFEGGRQAGEVEGGAAQEGFARGFGLGLQAFAIKAGEDEAVDRVARPGGVGRGGGRRVGAFRRDEGPVGFPFRALFDPLAEGRDFGGRESLLGIGRGHAARGVGRGDAGEQDAGGGVAFDDGVAAAAEVGFGEFLAVEAEGDLLERGVRAVAGEAFVGEDGADVAVEGDGRRGLGREREGGSEKDEGAAEHRYVFYARRRGLSHESDTGPATRA